MNLGSELRKRVITGGILGAVVVACVFAGSTVLVLLTTVVLLAVAFEFSGIVASGPRRTLPFLVGTLPGLLILLPTSAISTSWWSFISATALVVLVLFSMFRGIDRTLVDSTALSLLYPGALGIALVSLAQAPTSYLIWFLFLVAASDTGAYFGGRRLGGPKLAPAISPNKTISGALSGIFAAALFSALYAALSPLSFPIFGSTTGAIITAGSLLVVISQLGDLAGSMVKRIYGVKDSGGILPGHGGVFDRVIAHLVAAPFFLALLP